MLRILDWERLNPPILGSSISKIHPQIEMILIRDKDVG